MLTSKSMMFNGEYIENLIEGYTTLNVTGREMAEIQVQSSEIGNRDGSVFHYKRYGPRTLTIEFCLEGDNLGFNPDNTELINRLNRLNGILDIDEEVPIIFRDEPDKYYIGTRTGQPNVRMGLGIISGTFQIYCSDPFKYSNELITATPAVTEASGSRTFVIDYNGTHKTYPKYKVQFYTQNRINGDPEAMGIDEGTTDITSKGDENEEIAGKGACGYVAFMDDNEHILQFGNPDEDGTTPTTTIKKALVNQSWYTIGSYGSSVQQKWLPNIVTDAVLPTDFTERGSFAIGTSYNSVQSTTTSGTLLNGSAGTKCKYTVKATAKTRTPSRVTLEVTINASFTDKIPKEGVLKAYINVAGNEQLKTLKAAGTEWAKGKTISTTWSFYIYELESYQDIINSITFRVERTGGMSIDVVSYNSKQYACILPHKANNSNKPPNTTYWKLRSELGTLDPGVTINSKGNWASGTSYVTGNGTGRRTQVTCSSMPIPVYLENVTNSYYLTPDPESIPSGVNGKYYGPTICRTIPEDASGSRGWTDFTFDVNCKCCIGSGTNDIQQMGGLIVGVITGTLNGEQLTNRKILAGAIVYKYQAGNTGYHRIIGNGNYLQPSHSMDLSYYNKYFGNRKGSGANPNRHITITKTSSTIKYSIGGIEYTWKTGPANGKAYQVFVGAYWWSGKPRIDWLGFQNVKFTPNKVAGVDTTIPFTTGDLLEADSATGEIFLNGSKRMDLGALGNDWETMCLRPGLNQINTSFSDWCNDTAYRQCNSDDIYDEEQSYYTKSGDTYISASPTEVEYVVNPSEYYILESCEPQFSIEYREVYS